MQTHNPLNVEVLYQQDTRRATVTGARVLMGLVAVGALAAAATSTHLVRDAGPETLVVEIWRFAGFVLFSGLFALLAYRPLHYADVWELVIVNKLALTIAALTYASGAGVVALVDGILTAALLAVYLLSRGWRACSSWPRAARARPVALPPSAPSPPPEPPHPDGRVSTCGGMRLHFPIERDDSETRTNTDRADSALMSGSAEASFQARQLLARSHKVPYTHYLPWWVQ